MQPTLPLIEKKLLNRERLSTEDGLYLLAEAPLNWLGTMSMEERFRRMMARVGAPDTAVVSVNASAATATVRSDRSSDAGPSLGLCGLRLMRCPSCLVARTYSSLRFVRWN